MQTEAAVRDALRNVIDPELGLDVIELGMVGAIEVGDEGVLVNLCLTSMSCPFWDLFVDQVKSAVDVLDDVGEVRVQFDRAKPWSPDRMSDRARAHLEGNGILPRTLFRPGGEPIGDEQLLQISMDALAGNRRAGEAG
ncbi:MAG: metal-sulfur cluster assembly factor [Solirubrobacterales bacterium]